MIPNEVLYKRDLTGGLVRWWGRVEKLLILMVQYLYD